jgi:hypothetical protein
MFENRTLGIYGPKTGSNRRLEKAALGNSRLHSHKHKKGMKITPPTKMLRLMGKVHDRMGPIPPNKFCPKQCAF